MSESDHERIPESGDRFPAMMRDQESAFRKVGNGFETMHKLKRPAGAPAK